MSFAGVPDAADEGEEHDQKQEGGSGAGDASEVYEEAVIWAFD